MWYLVCKHMRIEETYLCKLIRVVTFQLVVEASNELSCRVRVILQAKPPYRFVSPTEQHTCVLYLNNHEKISHLHDATFALARRFFIEAEVSHSNSFWVMQG